MDEKGISQQRSPNDTQEAGEANAWPLYEPVSFHMPDAAGCQSAVRSPDEQSVFLPLFAEDEADSVRRVRVLGDEQVRLCDH